MARPLRLQFAGAIYHVTSHGNARGEVFFTGADRELFLRTLSSVVSRPLRGGSASRRVQRCKCSKVQGKQVQTPHGGSSI
jgi:hypothetical protein